MRIVVLSSFPWLDRHPYKKLFLTRLAKKPYVRAADVTVVYGKSRLLDYRSEVSRLGLSEALGKLKRLTGRSANGHETPTEIPSGLVAETARRLGMSVAVFGALKSADCIRFVREKSPNVIVNLSGMFVPKELLTLTPTGVLSAHYGLLPELRGTDVVRWSVYLGLPITVCHMALAEELDMGDVLLKQRVAVKRGDDIAEIYRKCQVLSAEGHLRLLDDVHAGRLLRQPQEKKGGSEFFRMGPFLQKKVDETLVREAYGHYE